MSISNGRINLLNILFELICTYSFSKINFLVLYFLIFYQFVELIKVILRFWNNLLIIVIVIVIIREI